MSAVSGNVFFCLGSAFGLLSQEGAHGLQAVHQGLPVAGVAHPDAVLLLEAVAWGDEGLKEKNVVKSGDVAVVTAGVVSKNTRHEPASSTNIMRVVVVE